MNEEIEKMFFNLAEEGEQLSIVSKNKIIVKNLFIKFTFIVLIGI